MGVRGDSDIRVNGPERLGGLSEQTWPPASNKAREAGHGRHDDHDGNGCPCSPGRVTKARRVTAVTAGTAITAGMTASKVAHAPRGA
jgi:hypothetical protein